MSLLGGLHRKLDRLIDRKKILNHKLQKAALEKASAPTTAPTKDEFLKTARLVVKAAHRFGSLTDRRQQKALLSELLQEIHVRHNQIISFKFRAAPVAGLGDADATETILLPKPVWVGRPPDDLPPHHKRSIKCSEVKSESDFYLGLNRCNPCRIAADRDRHSRRRAAKKAGINRLLTRRDGESHTSKMTRFA